MISRRTWYALSAIAAGMGVAGCQPKASNADLSPADVTAIGAVLDVMPREFKAKNADAAVAPFSTDAVLLEDGRINRGKESILNDHIKPEAAAMTVVTFSSNDRTIKGRGGLAYTTERYVIEANDAEGKTAFKADSAWYTTVQERQPDGSWKIVLGHFSSPMPPEPAAPPPPARKR